MRPIVMTAKIFTPDECDFIIDIMKSELEPAKTMGGYTPKIRRGRTSWVTKQRHPQLEELVNRMRGVMVDIGVKHHQTRVKYFEGMQFTEYKAGNYYKWHSDTTGDPGPMRTMSGVVELSDPKDYLGGGLEVWAHGLNKPKMERGMLYTFPSILTHRAKTVWWGTRHSLVTWALDRPAGETGPDWEEWTK